MAQDKSEIGGFGWSSGRLEALSVTRGCVLPALLHVDLLQPQLEIYM